MTAPVSHPENRADKRASGFSDKVASGSDGKVVSGFIRTSDDARKSFAPIVGGLLLMAAALGVAFWGITTRKVALAEVTQETREMATPTVVVIHPQRGVPQQEIVLPGTMQAFIDAPIYARTNGYLKKWYVDIGTHVRAGQLLADIDVPEVDQQLMQARADLATAEANARLARTTAERYRDLIKSDSVAQQDVDNANGSFEARQAAVESARANVRRLEELRGFRQIVAPFDGVVTARNVDVGALIESGNNAKELFHVASVSKLRVFVNVPELSAPAAQPGLTAELTLDEFPDRRVVGTLVRTAQAIDVASRTLLAEIDVDNPNGELLPGSYARVHLKLQREVPTFKLPVSAFLFRSEGVRVAIVGEDNRVVLKPITLGRDFGTEVEVVAGLNGNETIIDNPPDSVESGQVVRVHAAPEQAAPAAPGNRR
jgi:RND family efflux transporter MFP subunit